MSVADADSGGQHLLGLTRCHHLLHVAGLPGRGLQRAFEAVGHGVVGNARYRPGGSDNCMVSSAAGGHEEVGTRGWGEGDSEGEWYKLTEAFRYRARNLSRHLLYLLGCIVYRHTRNQPCLGGGAVDEAEHRAAGLRRRALQMTRLTRLRVNILLVPIRRGLGGSGGGGGDGDAVRGGGGQVDVPRRVRLVRDVGRLDGRAGRGVSLHWSADEMRETRVPSASRQESERRGREKTTAFGVHLSEPLLRSPTKADPEIDFLADV